jgi:hypothetical protein
MSTILLSNKIVYKVATCYTPYQLVYGLHPLMPIEYILPAISVDDRDIESTKILTTKITKFEKLHENKLEVQKQGWRKSVE